MEAPNSSETVWNAVFERVKPLLSGGGCVDWSASLLFAGLDDKNLTITFSSTLAYNEVNKKLGPEIARIVEEVTEKLGQKRTLVFQPPSKDAKTASNTENTKKETFSAPPPSAPQAEKTKNAAARPGVPVKKSKNARNASLRPQFSFENYVVAENNEFAVNAAMAVSRNPGNKIQYNPLFIYGGVGLGKTHLIEAIGNYIHANSDLNVLYVAAENFMNDFIESINSKTQTAFRKKYRGADVLLIDDIQNFEGKEGTQNEFFNTFNTLTRAEKQLVFTCDRPITELRKWSERLTSRLGSGLQVDLQLPNLETRWAILRKKAEEMNLKIDDKILQLIAEKVTSNTREAVGALNKLAGFADLTKKPLTLETAEKQLQTTFSSVKPTNLSIETIMKVVAEFFDVSVTDMKSKKRTGKLVHPRHLAMHIAVESTGFSLSDVGAAFNRDHSTVIHANESIKKRKLSDPTEEATIQNLTRLAKEQSAK